MNKDIQIVPGIKGARRATEVPGREGTNAVPDTEVAEKPTRRRFTAEYKQHSSSQLMHVLRRGASALFCAEKGSMHRLLPTGDAKGIKVLFPPLIQRKEAGRHLSMYLLSVRPRNFVRRTSALRNGSGRQSLSLMSKKK